MKRRLQITLFNLKTPPFVSRSSRTNPIEPSVLDYILLKHWLLLLPVT